MKLNLDDNLIRDLYENKNLSTSQIAKQMNTSTPTIFYRLKKMGVLMRSPGQQESESIKQEKASRIKKMTDMYQNGQTLAQIGQHFNLTRERIRQLLHKEGQKRRTNLKLSQDKVTIMQDLYKGNKTVKHISKILDVNRGTIYAKIKSLELVRTTPRYKLTQAQIESLGALYTQKKLSIHKIAELMDVTEVTILRHLKREGVKTRKRGEHVAKLSQEQVSQITTLYTQEKLTVVEIAKMFGVTNSAIYTRLKSLGVQTRQRGRMKL